MTVRGIRIATVLVVGIGVAALAGRAVRAQELKARTGQTVVAQIIPADQEDEFIKGAVPEKTPGLLAPVATRMIDPKYTANAMRAKIQGVVTVQAIVGVDGLVEKSRVKESLNPDLDAEALRAMDQWRFEAGRLNGVPARVLVEINMSFRLH